MNETTAVKSAFFADNYLKYGIDMRKIFFFALMITLSPPLFSIEIYECKDEHNNPYFTQTPCGSGTVIHKINSTKTRATGSESNSSNQPGYVEEYEKGKLRSKLRSIDFKIKKLRSEIESLTIKRDKETDIYLKKISRNEEKAGKNKKKAALRNKGYQEKIVSIKEKYDSKIAEKQHKISELLEEKDAIK